LPALQAFVAHLPADLQAAVFIVSHVRPTAVSQLPRILSAGCALPVAHAQDGERIEPGRIRLAQPDHHLLLETHHVAVRKGPRENRFRPSIDALFRSAAYRHGPRVIGIVLSGALSDGTSGLWSIKRLGGTTIVQDPDEAVMESMPLSALQEVQIDYVMQAHLIGPLITELLRAPAHPANPLEQEMDERMRMEVEAAAGSAVVQVDGSRYGVPTQLTCPECHGGLVRIREGLFTRYRCHTGHAFSKEALLAGINAGIEPALWGALRAMEESVLLLQEMARELRDTGRGLEAERLHEQACETRRQADDLKRFVLGVETLEEESGG
jgi:two-component system chemotaxis response regulator CheB